MAKLKLGAIADDKPVKLTIELPAAIHRDLVAYANVLGRETGQGRSRAGEADRTDAGALHGDRSGVRKIAADRLCGTALAVKKSAIRIVGESAPRRA